MSKGYEKRKKAFRRMTKSSWDDEANYPVWPLVLMIIAIGILVLLFILDSEGVF